MKRLLITVLALVAGLCTATPASAALLSIRFEPSAQVIALGDTATIDIYADLADGLALAGFDFGLDVTGDPGVLGGESFDLNEPLFATPGLAFGPVAGFAFPDFAPSGTVYLGSLEYTGLALGTAHVSAADATGFIPAFTLIGDAGPISLLFDSPEVDLSLAHASITVVPLPAPALMAGIGLVAVAGLRRRRESATDPFTPRPS